MISRKSLLWLAATIFATLSVAAVPRVRTAEMRKEAVNLWLPTWKNTWKEPYEPFVEANHKVPMNAVCQGDMPCAFPPAGTPEYISKSVASWLRFPQDVWEDATSKPWQMLAFIGVKPGDKVVDFLPGNRHVISMYWSRLFYHVVGDEGRTFVFIPSIGCRAAHVSGCQMERDFSSSSNGYGKRAPYTLLGDPRWNGIDEALDIEHLTAYRNLYTMLDVAGQFSIPQQADIVWSTAHWHSIHGEVYDIDMSDFLPRLFESMANGGSLVIADYAGNPGTGFTQVNTLHRIDKEAVKAELVKYGFVFDSESNLWAMKDDDHTKPVPEESMAGTADMFILKFKKPMNAPPSRRPSREEMAGWLDTNYTGSGTMEHGQRGGGGTWHMADYTGMEFQGPGDGILKSWYMDATGALCERQEWEPITAGIIGCHYERDRIVQYKLGSSWEQRTEFATDDPNATGFRAVTRKGLSPWHTFIVRPADCPNIFVNCSSYSMKDNVAYGHIR